MSDEKPVAEKALAEIKAIEKTWPLIRTALWSLARRHRYLTVVLVLVGVFLGYDYFWGVRTKNRELSQKLTKAREQLGDARETITSLSRTNETFHRDILFYRSIFDPIKRQAETLYPELESKVAIAKLAEELKEVRGLATQSNFKPLSAELKAQLLTSLRSVQKAYPTNILIDVCHQTGSEGRARLAEEFAGLLKEAGVSVNYGGARIIMPDPTEVAIRVYINPATGAKYFAEIADAVGPLINTRFTLVWNPGTATNSVQVQFMGTPAFLPNGAAVFH